MVNNYLYFGIQIVLLIVVAIIVIKLLLVNRSQKKEKRLSRFTIDTISIKQIAFSDRMEITIDKLITNFSKILSKSTIMSKYGSHFEKYVDQSQKIKEKAMDYVSIKFLLALLAIIITFIADVLRMEVITIPQILLSLLVGFFITDIYLIIRNKKREKLIEEDLLKAVIIMGNAFKSGRNTMQAIELVSTELTGPISNEFRKMYIDLTYGLELDVVFKRFSERVKLEEVKYISSSLVILNKTGGNITNIFDSIENSFFDRKKLKDELKSISALSELVFKILVGVPFIIFIVIYLFNNDYFNAFITTSIGRIVLVIIVLIYVLYILVAKKIMKFKEW